jgi:hypothetical protein
MLVGHKEMSNKSQKNVGEIPKEISTYLKLPNPELHTGHSFLPLSQHRSSFR